MIKLDFAKNKTYYVVGLGKSNRAVIKALQKSDATIRIWDDNPDNLDGFDKKIIRPLEKAPWSTIKAVIAAPGIPPSHAIIQMAESKNIPVLCDIDLYAQSHPKCKIIGVTGTNGKSTVTALINHILENSGTTQMGGNIGTPVMSLKNRVDYTVLELSSYQLERSPHLKCNVAVLLNITPDHLEWHGDMDRYIAAKSRILNNATTHIISVDDRFSKTIFDQYENAIALSIFDENLPFNQNDFPRLKGTHNFQNCLAAYYACHALGIPHDLILKGMETFEGLMHRQYLVATINGIPYINDSKATNATATRTALEAYRNIFWIAGGRAKTGGLADLDSRLDNVNMAFLYGESAQDFFDFLQSRGVEAMCFETMDEALDQAHIKAQSMRGEPSGSPTVLLSPACASFDQYKNFEDRGDHFTNLVSALKLQLAD